METGKNFNSIVNARFFPSIFTILKGTFACTVNTNIFFVSCFPVHVHEINAYNPFGY